jgi:hypothetical protein
MKQHLIRPPSHITSINVGMEGVIFTDGQPEWVSTPVAIALLHRGASNEGERDILDPAPQMVQNPDPAMDSASTPEPEPAPAMVQNEPRGVAGLFQHSKKNKKQR